MFVPGEGIEFGFGVKVDVRINERKFRIICHIACILSGLYCILLYSRDSKC